MTSKHCTKCKELKPLSEFHKDNGQKSGYSSHCKSCKSETHRQYRRSKHGLIVVIYTAQTYSSKKRDYKHQNYTLASLRNWAFGQSLFHRLYAAWVKSGYKTNLRPSFDRIDDYKSYTLDNLQIMTWADNHKKAANDRKNGVNNKHSKAVIQMTRDGLLVAEYHSQQHAARQINVTDCRISECCLGKRKTVSGYRWMTSLGVPIANNLRTERGV